MGLQGRSRVALLGVLACMALVTSACSADTEPNAAPSASPTPALISAASAQRVPLAKRIRSVTPGLRVGTSTVAFGSVWSKTGEGDVIKIDASTGKLQRTYRTDVVSPEPGCEG